MNSSNLLRIPLNLDGCQVEVVGSCVPMVKGLSVTSYADKNHFWPNNLFESTINKMLMDRYIYAHWGSSRLSGRATFNTVANWVP